MDSPLLWMSQGRLLCIPLHRPEAVDTLDNGLHHAAKLGNHVQTLLLAQILRTHDRLLV